MNALTGGVKKKKRGDNIYCGVQSKAPTGKVLGTGRECAKKHQVRRFGIKLIDKKILSDTEELDRLIKAETKAVKEMTKYRLEIHDLRTKIKYEKNEKKKERLETKLEKNVALFKKFKELYHKFKKKREKAE